ncbi:MAG: glycosyltransferase family 4 protein [Acidimicrobiia bacterium]|nr:glycosyltransferase family 4 protein [Acidimicrobiia bacterium]
MNVAFVCLNLEMGGIETNLVLLTRQFVRKGHQVTVISNGGPLERDIIREGGRAERLALYRTKAFTSGPQLAKTLRRVKPDVVHVFAASCCVAMWVARTFFRPWPGRRPPVVVSSVMGLQNSPDEPMITTFLRNWLLTLGVDLTIMTSPVIARHFRFIPISRRRLRAQPVCGVVLPERPPHADLLRLRSGLGLRPDDRVVATIGQLEPRKSHDLFIRAAAIVCETHRDVQFLIAGEGRLRQDLTALIEELGVRDRVRLLGLRRDVPALLSLADVCVKPGIVDGFLGITVLEAQSVGTPVVAFDAEDIREAIIDGRTGLLARNGDYRDLAAKLTDLLDDPAKAGALARQGHALVRERFDIEVVAGGLLTLYDAVQA